MKNDCSLVKDLLPLYIEEMVSLETADFVNNHLQKCHECRAELEQIKGADMIISRSTSAKAEDTAKSFKKIMKRFKRQFYSFGYAVIVFLSFLGFWFMAGESYNVLYNILIMPVIGILGYSVFGGSAICKIPLAILIVDLIVYAFRLSEYQLMGIGFGVALIYALVFSAFALVGVAIAFLLHYALKKEDEK